MRSHTLIRAHVRHDTWHRGRPDKSHAIRMPWANWRVAHPSWQLVRPTTFDSTPLLWLRARARARAKKMGCDVACARCTRTRLPTPEPASCIISFFITFLFVRIFFVSLARCAAPCPYPSVHLLSISALVTFTCLSSHFPSSSSSLFPFPFSFVFIFPFILFPDLPFSVRFRLPSTRPLSQSMNPPMPLSRRRRRWVSRDISHFQQLEQVGEGTYG